MEYYLILKDNDYIGQAVNTYRCFVSTILLPEHLDKPLLTYENYPNVAFATNNKICIDVRDKDVSLKDQLIYSLSQIKYDLNDTSIFKRITAKEYYSLLD